MRRVSRLGDTAVGICTRARRRYPSELKALIFNICNRAARLVDGDILFRCGIGLSLERTARIAREVDPVAVMEECDAAIDGAARGINMILVKRCYCYSCQVEHRRPRCHVRRVKFHLLEAANARSRVSPFDIQRVARSVCLCAARDRTIDGCAVEVHSVIVRGRAFAARDCARIRLDGDGIARGFTESLTADNCTRD